MTNTVRTRLEKVRSLIASPHHWLKGSLCNGHGRYCLLGAVQAVCPSAKRSFTGTPPSSIKNQCLRQLSYALPLDFDSLAQFNDHRSTEHKDVLALIDTAIDLID